MTVERHLILQDKELPASAEWLPHVHAWLGLRVAAGQGYWLQSGVAVRSLTTGDVLFMGGNVNGAVRASQLGSLCLQYFTVTPQTLTGIMTLVECRQLEMALNNRSLPVLFFEAREAIAQKFTALANPVAEDHLASRCACLQLWAEVFASLLTEPPENRSADDKLRGRFLQLVGQIPQADLVAQSLPDLAAQLHCSERHFSRLFREQFGASLRSRQIELRLEHARQLLANSNTKIINVAYESGYRHVGLFNAMFKKRFGLTPSEWRRQNLKKTFSPRQVSVRRSAAQMLLHTTVGLFLGLSSVQLGLAQPTHASTATPRHEARITTEQVSI